MPRSEDRFVRSLNRWWQRQQDLAAGGPAPGWLRDRSADDLAGELARDLRFELAQAGFAHRHPDRSTALSAVLRLEPKPDPDESELLADAIVRAGTTSRRVRVTTAGALLTVLALVVRNVLRGR